MIIRKFLDELYARKHEFESGRFHAKQKMEQAEQLYDLARETLKKMPKAERAKHFPAAHKDEQNFYSARHSYCVWEDRLLHLNALIDKYVETHQPESKA